ncbi:unnamed protein product [Blepharisma stoltei]|uniref:IQ motif and ubiquitin-like domain-containing protein n=1 Tax=Blepharisma stoltei TaxID=1481888 RepID=A0AAU9IJA4_9CILI|nr:unnamed protein product [Blepharisma stoltei]
MEEPSNEHEYFESIQIEQRPMPDVLEVEVTTSEGAIKVVTVEVIKASGQKPYLGGYRNSTTRLNYYHSATNTDQPRREYKEKFHREVQVFQYRTRSTIMKKEFGTQMEKPGLVSIDPRRDVEVEPGEYFTSEMWEEVREKAALYIQCCTRRWFAYKRRRELKRIRDSNDRKIIEKQEELRREEEAKHKTEIERRMHPKSTDDFEILYKELEMWRLKETERIKTSNLLLEEEKKKALEQLLHKETKLLQTIDRLKITAGYQNKEEKIAKFLKAMSDPKKWRLSDGRFTDAHTPWTTRAKELMELYNGLKMKHLSIDERLDVLLHTKWTVKEFDCNLTREIVDLIDREADMLNRGRSEGSLEGLRKRLANLFLQFVETPDFNPEAARFQKVPKELLQNAMELELSN